MRFYRRQWTLSVIVIVLVADSASPIESPKPIVLRYISLPKLFVTHLRSDAKK